MALRGRGLVAAMCLGQVGNLLPHVALPSVLAQSLMPEWGLSATQGGLLASSYAFGYMLAVPFLATLTDRVDARKVLLGGTILSGAATIALGAFAQGMYTAMFWWALAGIGFGGAYMPGLKALSDRLGTGDISRSVTLYTASFSFGVGISFLVSQLAAEQYGWRAAFVITGLGPLLMIAVALCLEPKEPPPAKTAALDFKPVFQNKTALGYVLGYGVHCFELYGMRTWLVAFWTFVAASHGGAALASALAVSVAVSVAALPASIFGNELAIRFGRHRTITVIMLLSSATALLIGLNAGGSPAVLLLLLALYSVTVPADSGALTSGMTISATPSAKGATMALHSTVGFGLSAVGAWGMGVAIDLAGGPGRAEAWTAGFALLFAVGLIGPLSLLWSRRTGSQSSADKR